MSAVIPQSEIERRRSDLDFENVWTRLANKEWRELKAACRYAYDAGRDAGKAEGLRKATAESYLKPIKEKV